MGRVIYTWSEKGNHHICKNYRGVILLTDLSKVLTYLLIIRSYVFTEVVEAPAVSVHTYGPSPSASHTAGTLT